MKNFITRVRRCWSTSLAALLLVTMIAGCSAVRLGYNHGETLTYWWLDSYIDINAAQKPWVKKDIANLFGWHRHAELKSYVQLLTQAQQTMQQPVTPADLQPLLDAGRRRAMALVDHALPDLADLALSLTPAQLDQLAHKFAANNDKYRRDFVSGNAAQQQRARFKKVMEQAEYWFGDFSDAQEAQIRRASDARPLVGEQMLAERQFRQRQLLALLRRIQAEHFSRETTIGLLRDYAAAMIEHAGGGTHEQVFDASRDQMFKLIAVIVNCATPAQKAHAARQLQQWINNFSTLAAQAA